MYCLLKRGKQCNNQHQQCMMKIGMGTWEPVSPSQSTNMPDKLRVDQMDGGPWI